MLKNTLRHTSPSHVHALTVILQCAQSWKEVLWGVWLGKCDLMSWCVAGTVRLSGCLSDSPVIWGLCFRVRDKGLLLLQPALGSMDLGIRDELWSFLIPVVHRQNNCSVWMHIWELKTCFAMSTSSRWLFFYRHVMCVVITCKQCGIWVNMRIWFSFTDAQHYCLPF